MSTPPPATPPPGPGGGAQNFTVNKDNVLAAGKMVSQATEKAYAELSRLQFGLAITRPADDQISTAAASTWNNNLLLSENSHYNRLRQYVDTVGELAKQLEDAAKQYGYTDEEIADSFRTSTKEH